MQRFFGEALLWTMALTAAALCGSAAQASVNGSTISIAFARDEPVPGTNGCALNPTDMAGVPGYQTANWVNETTDEGSDTTSLVRDDNGVATAITTSVTWVCDNTWSNDGLRDGGASDLFPLGPDQVLMNGYMDIGSAANPDASVKFGMPATDIEITNLPADFAAGFSVIIYTLGGAVNRPELLYVNDPNLVSPLYVMPGGPGGATTWLTPQPLIRTYMQAIGDDPSYGPDSFGNYVVVTNDGNGNPLQGTSVSIYALPNTFRAAVNAVQIVKNP
jgi:hypothetical protein